jgi:urease accessory protein
MALGIALTAVPGAALAHPSIAPTQGFAQGMAHPLQGLDHIVAMVAVGMIAARMGGRALWALPCAFLSMMALGGFLGMEGVKVPFVETGILLSLPVFGFAAAFNWKPPTVLAVAVSGLFAVFHGHAHGSEMTAGISGAAYGGGFMLATALLLFTGICFGTGLERVLTEEAKEVTNR